MVESRPHFLVIGGTSAIAEHVLRAWLSEEDCEVTLLARDLKKANAIAADLHIRYPKSEIRCRSVDFLDAVSISTEVSAINKQAAIRYALIAHGVLSNQTDCQSDLVLADSDLKLNAVSPALFAEAILSVMASHGIGNLGVIGSVAGDRGRKSNYVYGAAKGMLERFVEGQQHRMTGSRVKISLIKPGPTQTPMTAGLVGGPKLAPVDKVAANIAKGLRNGRRVIYAPGEWWLIMTILRHLPAFVFNRLNI